MSTPKNAPSKAPKPAPPTPPEHDPMHARLLAIVTALPQAYEDRPWGSVHCKVDGKIFVGWGRHEDGAMSLGFKTDKALQSMLVASDPRFTMAKYVGKHGWVDMALGKKPNWSEVEQFIVESYRLIAPKKLVKLLDGGAAPAPAKPRGPAPSAKTKTAQRQTNRGRAAHKER